MTVRRSRTAVGVVLLSLFTALPVQPQSRDLARFEAAKQFYRQGISYFNAMNYLAAAEHFRKAVKEYPEYHAARDYLARAFKLAGFTEDALKEWENLADAAPGAVAIRAKIDNLRFQEAVQGNAVDYSELVHHETYASSTYRRFGFDRPADIAVDSEKNLYITSFTTGKLVKIDANGKGVFTSKVALSSKLYGIDCRGGSLAVTDFQNDTVHILDLKGDVKLKFGGRGTGEGLFHGPEGICFNDAGELFVVDSGNDRVQKFSAAGTFILSMGVRGEYEGQLRGPADAAFFGKHLYVTDTGNNRIACFDDSGNFVKNIAIEGLESPRGITRSGDLLQIADEKKGLCSYNPEDGSARWLSSWNNGKGRFARLVAAVTDREGYLYCLDYNADAVQLFTPVRRRYANLAVEIASVDTKSFPVVAYYLTVRGRDGRPAYGLEPANFRLTEDGAIMSGVSTAYLKRMAPSVSLTLCVDRSTDMSGHHGDLPWVAEFILQKMRKNDSIRLFNFNGEVWPGSNFDWSRRRTLNALKKNEYGEGKDFGTALYSALGDLVPRLNRRAVVVVTDGTLRDDSFKTYSARAVIQYARSHYIPVYFVCFKKPHDTLALIARETGGQVILPREADRLRALYERVKVSEEYRYVVVYSTFKLASFKGWWSDVKIEVEHKGQTGVEWGGYFVP